MQPTETHIPSSTDTDAGSQRARRLRRTVASGACALAVLAAPGVAAAADTLVAADPAVDRVAALDGVLVWSSGTFGDQVLMQRSNSGVIARVRGAPRAALYSTIDLGRDRKNRLVLTYLRCTKSSCTAIMDNLRGRRSSFRHLTLKRCSLATAPAVWRTRLAYGLSCRKPNKQADDKRTGLYVKTGSGTPRRMRLPRKAAKSGARSISGAVDLRATRVAAVAADIAEYAFTETVARRGLRSILVALSEGDSNEHATGLALGSSGVMWTLTDAEHAGDPNRAIIFKVSGSCYQSEALINPAGPKQEEGYLASDLAVDRTTLYLVVPGTGIVIHSFAPEGACTPLN